MISKKHLIDRIINLDILIREAVDSEQYQDAFAYSAQKRILQDILQQV